MVGKCPMRLSVAERYASPLATGGRGLPGICFCGRLLRPRGFARLGCFRTLCGFVRLAAANQLVEAAAADLQRHVPQGFTAFDTGLRELGEFVPGAGSEGPRALRILERRGGRDQRGRDDVRDHRIAGERLEAAATLAGSLLVFLLSILGHGLPPSRLRLGAVIPFSVTRL